MTEFVITPAIEWLERLERLSDPSVSVVRPAIELLNHHLCACESDADGFVTFECSWIYGRDAASSRHYESAIANALDEVMV